MIQQANAVSFAINLRLKLKSYARRATQVLLGEGQKRHKASVEAQGHV